MSYQSCMIALWPITQECSLLEECIIEHYPRLLPMLSAVVGFKILRQKVQNIICQQGEFILLVTLIVWAYWYSLIPRMHCNKMRVHHILSSGESQCTHFPYETFISMTKFITLKNSNKHQTQPLKSQ